MLGEKEREGLFERIKEQSGQRWGCFKCVTNHGSMAGVRNLQKIKEAIKVKTALLVLVKAGRDTLGLFCNLEKGRAGVLSNTKGSFLFYSDGGDLKVLPKGGDKDPLAAI